MVQKSNLTNTKFDISQKEYASRRKKIFDEMPMNSIAILKANSLCHRNGDAEYSFRQESNFYYLTGFNEQEAVLILLKENNAQEFILFCLEKNKKEETWTGPRIGVKNAKAYFSADKAYVLTELDNLMPQLLENKIIYYNFGSHLIFDQKMLQWSNKDPIWTLANGKNDTHCLLHEADNHEADNKALTVTSYKPDWRDLKILINKLRIYKSPAEIAIMREAARISCEAHKKLMQKCKTAKWEYQLESEFIYECLQLGARFMSYTPIVASGSNACILHYNQNNQPLNPGELLLVDAGAEFENYASDITRTFPINGKFTVEQRAIYELVLKSQVAAIEAVKPGIAWSKLQDIIVSILVKGLVSLGILKGDPQTLIQEKAYRDFYMHSSGHWLGLDVHDAGHYKERHKEDIILQENMVITIEPGLYFAPDHEQLDDRWCGIGVRIEDDILVTKQGFEILSNDVPKTVFDIEMLMQTSDQTSDHVLQPKKRAEESYKNV